MDAYRVGLLWADVVHHEGAVNAAQLVGFGRQGVVDGMRPHDGVWFVECIAPMAGPRVVTRIGDHRGS